MAALRRIAGKVDHGQNGCDMAETKKGLVVLPRRWVAERNFDCAARFRPLAKDCERLPGSDAWTAFPGVRHRHASEDSSTADDRGKCMTRFR